MINSSEVERIITNLYPTTKSSMQVAFISNGEVEFSSTFGTKKNYWFSSEKANDETLFQAASLSKPISAIICMILVQKEVLDLDKDVKEYLQGSSLEFDGITLRQLLSHTASIGVGGYVGYGINVELKTTLEIAQEVKENANVNRGDFSYSGGGYQVMQFILVHVTKKPFEQLAVELLFKPLGMKNSTFETIKDFKDRNVSFATAEWYLPEFQYFGEYPYMVHPEKSAAGLWTTATDYARFCVEFLKCLDGNGMILSKENAKEMLKDQTSGNEKWGLGFGLDSGDSGVFGHTGANVGFRTVFKLDPVLKSGYVILQNREGSAAYRARYQVGKLAHSVYGLQFKYGEMADMASAWDHIKMWCELIKYYIKGE